MRRILTLLAVLVPSALAAAPPLSHSSVYVSVDLGNGSTAGGTGTVIACEDGKSLILTNAHVVESGALPVSVTYWYEGYAYKSPVTYLGGSSVTHPGLFMIEVHGPDLALLMLPYALPAVEIAAAIPAAGTAVSLYGFGGAVDGAQPLHKTGRVLAESGWRTTAGDPMARTSIASVNGDSGSGIFNSAGQLVAVHWGGGAVRLDTVRAFTASVLKRKGFQRFRDRLVETNP